jgi:cell wall-associated NlpC family hydrolase
MDKQMTFGAIPSEYDPRDYTVSTTVKTFPESFRLPDVEIYNQGKVGNCVMQALRGAVHYYEGTEMGATYGYGTWRDHNGSGMSPKMAVEGLRKEGIPPVTVDKEFLEVPDAISYAAAKRDTMLTAAKPYIGITYARPSTIAEIKALLMDGVRCAVCLPFCGITNDKWETDGDVKGYHEMLIIGWDKDQWIIRNSWGTGKQGLGADRKDGYVTLPLDKIFACNDVIAIFPRPQDAPQDDKQVVVVRTLRLQDPYMRGDDVLHAQERLNVHGYTVTADGIFGAKTDAAVRAFQLAKSLTVDGAIGPKTLAALDAEPEERRDPDVVSALKADFRLYLFEQLGNIYVWGGNGQTAITDSIIKGMENSTANYSRAVKAWKVRLAAGQSSIRMFDCSGLISRWLQDHGYATSRRNCNALYAMCSPVSLTDIQPLDLVFRGTATDKTHIGVYMGDGLVIEAQGRDYGVVIRGINLGNWRYAGRLNIMK